MTVEATRGVPMPFKAVERITDKTKCGMLPKSFISQTYLRIKMIQGSECFAIYWLFGPGGTRPGDCWSTSLLVPDDGEEWEDYEGRLGPDEELERIPEGLQLSKLEPTLIPACSHQGTRLIPYRADENVGRRARIKSQAKV